MRHLLDMGKARVRPASLRLLPVLLLALQYIHCLAPSSLARAQEDVRAPECPAQECPVVKCEEQERLRETVQGLEREAEEGKKAREEGQKRIKELELRVAAVAKKLERAEEQLALEEGKGKQVKKALSQSEEEVKRQSQLLKSITSLLPESPGEGAAAADRSGAGEFLLRRAGHAAKHIKELEGENASLQKQVSALEATVRERETKSVKCDRAHLELQQLRAELAKKHQDLARKHKEVEEIAAQWLPPWISDAIESAQDQTSQFWSEKALPALHLARSRSLEALELGRKKAQPHVIHFLKVSQELGASMHDAARPFLETALERHGTAVVWLKQQAAQLRHEANPYLVAARAWGLSQWSRIIDMASPYWKPALEVLTPYYQEAYAAAKPGLEAFLSGLATNWGLAKAALIPHINQLKEKTAAYQALAMTFAAESTKRAAGVTQGALDYMLIAELGLYLSVTFAVIAIAYYLVKSCMNLSFSKDARRPAKPKNGVPGKRAHHHHSAKKHLNSHH